MGQAVSRRLVLAKVHVRCHARQFHVTCMVGNVALGQLRVILTYIAYTNSFLTSQKTQNAFIININQAVCCEHLTGLTNTLCWESAEFSQLRLCHRT